MPTGYTAELMDKGQDFRSFALTCARAFGACVMQRDDPMNDLPKKQEANDYHAVAIKEAEERLASLKAMTPSEQRVEGNRLRQIAVDSATKSLDEDIAENERLESMAVQVRAWEPPTDEHKGLKDFMLEQINTSRNDLTWSNRWLREAADKTAEAYFVEAVSSAVRDIRYHAKEQMKATERNARRNEWIDHLYRSLP